MINYVNYVTIFDIFVSLLPHRIQPSTLEYTDATNKAGDLIKKKFKMIDCHYIKY